MAGLAYKNTFIKLFVFLLVLLGATIVHTPVAFADNAAGPFISKPMRDQMVDYQQLTYTIVCMPTTTLLNAEFGLPGESPMENVGANDMVFASNDELKNKKYLDQGVLANGVGRGSMFDNEALSCDTGADFGFVWPFTNFGRGNLVDFYCSLPGVYHNLTGGNGKSIAGGSNKAACVSGSKFENGKSFYVAKSGTNLREQVKAEFVKTKRGKAAAKPLTPAKKYLQYWMTFEKACGATLTTEYPKDSDPAANNGAVYRIPVVNQNGKLVEFIANTGGASTDGKLVVLDATHPYPGDTTCGQLAIGMRDTAPKYSAYLKGPGKNDPGATDGTGIPELDPNEEGSTDNTTSCGVEGIGWIICPAMEFMGKLNDAAFGFINDFLYIEPKLLADGDTYAAWKNFRDIANIAFIIAFLVIVYSQITSAGISNYGIKRMLPRIFVAALLVNLSYFVCQIAVDISNILGSSLYSFFKDMPTTDAISVTTDSMPSWQKVTAFILIGGAAIIAGLLLASTLGVAALLAFALVIFILIARKALLIILVVIAPLAFVAYLLPNTEKWFKSWWKMFSTLLMVFPIVAVIFGGSTLAARIVNNSGADPDNSNYMLQLTALGIMALPLFAVPAVLKGAMSAAGSIGGKLQGLADRSQSSAGAKAKARRERYGNQFKAGAIKIGSKVSNSEKFGKALGNKNSFRRRKLGALASLGATSAVDNAERDKYAKIAADAEARNYVADTASSSASYARSIAGGRLAPGSADMAKFVQSYALQAKREEDKKDIAAFRTKIAATPTGDFHEKMMEKGLSGAERAAYAAEIAARGPGDQFHKAMEASRYITNSEERQKVQSELLSNMREDHFGVSDEMRGLMATGGLDANYGKDSDGNSKRKTASGGEFSSAYDASFDTRMERKMNSDGIVTMKSHDMNVAKKLISSGDMTDDALKSMINNMYIAEQNPNTNVKIKGETKEMFDAAKALAQQRGIEVSEEAIAIAGSGTPIVSGAAPSTPPPEPTPIQVAAAPSYTAEQIRTMGPVNAQRAVARQGGVEAMHESDLIAIRNAHGSADVGQSARQELIRRGVINEPRRPNLP